MKKFTFFICLLLIVASSQATYAQKEAKVLRKEWAKRLKNTDPLEFKKLIEEREEAAEELKKLKDSTADLKQKLDSKSIEADTLRKSLTQLRSNIDVASAPQVNTVDATRVGLQRRGISQTQGLIYKVQIGAFKNKNLEKYLENHVNFSGDIDDDGTKKYTLGYFNDYWEADNFKKYLREMGVRDAWIVSYKDGRRVSMKDALEGAI
jgi:hypothetical protein